MLGLQGIEKHIDFSDPARDEQAGNPDRRLRSQTRFVAANQDFLLLFLWPMSMWLGIGCKAGPAGSSHT
jgi:hypothetical protein